MGEPVYAEEASPQSGPRLAVERGFLEVKPNRA